MIERVIYTLLADAGSAAARNAKARTKAKPKRIKVRMNQNGLK
jgi:hypothetical protein